jgi:hypothetical protein
MELLGIEVTPEEFNYLFCEQAKGKELRVVDKKVVAVEKILTESERAIRRINELKTLLQESDYKAIKFAEGLISIEDYASTKAQRQAWREEINILESVAIIEEN